MISFNRFLAWSFIIHLIIIIIGSVFGTSKKNDFVVFGAYSRYASHTQYKSSRITPFSNKRLGTSGKPGRGKSKRSGKKSRPTIKNHKQRSPKNTRKSNSAKKNNPKTTNQKNNPLKQKTSKTSKRRIAELDDTVIGKKASARKPTKKAPTMPPPPKPEEPEDDEPFVEEKKEPLPQKTQPESSQESNDSTANASSDDVRSNNKESVDNDATNDAGENGDGDGFSIDGVDDPEAIAHYQRYVQEEIDRVWRPPLGVKKGTVCTVSFTVDEKGEVQTCTMLKGSSVLIYDLSIMRIARSLHFHASLWGKQFKIDFCQ